MPELVSGLFLLCGKLRRSTKHPDFFFPPQPVPAAVRTGKSKRGDHMPLLAEQWNRNGRDPLYRFIMHFRKPNRFRFFAESRKSFFRKRILAGAYLPANPLVQTSPLLFRKSRKQNSTAGRRMQLIIPALLRNVGLCLRRILHDDAKHSIIFNHTRKCDISGFCDKLLDWCGKPRAQCAPAIRIAPEVDAARPQTVIPLAVL